MIDNNSNVNNYRQDKGDVLMRQKPPLKQMIEALESVGMTQVEISAGSGIAQSSISKIKNGKQSFVFHEKADALARMYRKRVVNKKAPSVA